MKSSMWGWGKSVVAFVVILLSVVFMQQNAFAYEKSYTDQACTSAGGTVIASDGYSIQGRDAAGTMCSFSLGSGKSVNDVDNAKASECSSVGGSINFMSGQYGSGNNYCRINLASTTASNSVNAKKSALIPKLCAPDRQTSGAMSADTATYANCASRVSVLYDNCSRPATSTQVITDDNIAACLSASAKNDSAITIKASTADLTSTITDADKNACESKGSGFSWDSTTNTCTVVDSSTESKSCQTNTQGFGWIICPGMSMLSSAINSAVGLISGGMEWKLLLDNTQLSGDANNKTASDAIRDAWGGIRTIANIAFAAAFMLIIYSTATSTGLSNYSVKKILPRLVIIAVGVNISFEICAALADISNIAGKGIYDLIISFMGGQRQTDWLEVAAREIAAGAVVLGLIIAGLIAWSATLIGLITIVAAIAMRSVLLTMLVIFSPLAFVAALLPNTEKWWKKWLNTYIQLLFVYPAFMAVWAICQLVANISSQTAGGWGWLIATLCVIAPLFIIIPLFKSSGGFMGKMTGWAQKGIGAAGGNKLRGLNKNSNAFLRNTGANMGKNAYSARKRWENSEFGKSRLGRVIGAGRFGKGVAGMISGVSSMSENMKERKAGRDKRDDLARMGRIVNKAENDPQFRAAVGAGRIISMQNKIEDEAINEEMAALSRQTIIDDSGNLRRIQASDMGKLIAGQNLTFADSGGGRTVMSMHGQSGTTKFGDNARMAIRRTVAASGGSTDKENLAASIFSIADEGERADAMDAIYKAGVPWVNGKRIPTMQTGGSGKDRVIPITDAELAQAGSGSGPNRLREIKYEMRRGAMTDGAFDVDQVADYDEGKFKAFMDPFAKFNENGEIETLDTSGLDSKAINNLRNILTSLGSGERATKFSRVQINEQNRLKALNDLNSRS